MVRVSAKIEKNTLLARLLDRVRAKYRKNTLFDRTLTRIRAIEE